MMTLLMTETRTDESLLPAVARGEEEAIEILLDRYWTRAYTLAYRLVGEASAAEDVAQETFIRVLENAARFDPSRRFRPWLFQILTNQARKHHRSAGRRAGHEAQAAALPRVEPSHGEQAEVVHACLATLPEQQREPIALHYLEGLTYQEIAEALAWPLGTVTSRVRRGLETLRTRLQPTYGFGPAVILSLLAESPALAVPGVPSPLEVIGAAHRAAPPRVTAAPAPGALLAAARPRRSVALLAAVALLPLAGVLGAAALLGEPGAEGLAARGESTAAKQPDPPRAAPSPDADHEPADQPAVEAVEADPPAPVTPAQAPSGPPAVALQPGQGAVAIRVEGAEGPLCDASLEGFLIISQRTGAQAGQVHLTTDEHGWLTLPGLPPCSISLDLLLGDLRAERLTLQVQAGEVTRATVALHPGATIDARLVADRPGVTRVMLRPLDAPDAAPPAPLRLEPGAEEVHVGALAAGRYELAVARVGFARVERVVGLASAEALDLGEIALGGAGVLSGRVLAGGQPAEADTVLWFRGDEVDLGRATTDADGRFRFAGVPPGQVTVGLPDGTSREVRVAAAGGLDLGDLVLGERWGRLAGRVFGPDGQAQVGLRLTLSGVTGTEEASTDDRGRFEFSRIEPGRYELAPPLGALTAGPQPVDLEAGAELTLDLTLSAGATVRGRVLPVGERTPTLRVSVAALDARPLSPPHEVALDAEGRYRVAGLPAGRYRVMVPGGAEEIEARPGEQVVVDFDLSAGAGALEVHLTGAQAPQRFVAFATDDEQGMLGMAPGGQGRVRLEDVPAGVADVGVVVPGSLPQLTVYARGVRVEPGRTAQVEIAWPDPAATGAVEGRVLGLTQAGGAGSHDQLSITARGERVELLAELAHDGSFSLPGLPAGDYELSLGSITARAPLAVGEVRVRVGETTAAELEFED
jgi:RNA polymerase sigma-70 factor, ECF subfamily